MKELQKRNCDFEIDFDDYGHITGEYWLSSDNPESSIPEHIAQNIYALLQPFLYADSEENSNSVDFTEETDFRKNNHKLSNIVIHIIILASLIFALLYFRNLKLFFHLLLAESIIMFLYEIVQWRKRIHKGKGEIKVKVSSGQLEGQDYNEAKRSLELVAVINQIRF